MSFIWFICCSFNIGIFASNLICILPDLLVCTSGIPCPVILNVVPGLVPAGTVKLNFLFVGVTTSIIVPTIKSSTFICLVA